MPLSIVIPVYNQWQYTHSLLLDIYQKLPKDTEVVIVDDCSTEQDVQSGLSWWKTLYKDRLIVHKNVTNQGFLKSCNIGVSRTSYEYVVLMNNDVKVYSDFSWVVLDAFSKYWKNPVLIGARLLDQDTGWNKIGEKVYPYLEGWFLAFRRKEWTTFGGFDEIYCPHVFEDVDISTTYLSKGGNLVPLELNIEHLCGKSIIYSPERDKLTKTNQKKFEEKWQTK